MLRASFDDGRATVLSNARKAADEAEMLENRNTKRKQPRQPCRGRDCISKEEGEMQSKTRLIACAPSSGHGAPQCRLIFIPVLGPHTLCLRQKPVGG